MFVLCDLRGGRPGVPPGNIGATQVIQSLVVQERLFNNDYRVPTGL